MVSKPRVVGHKFNFLAATMAVSGVSKDFGGLNHEILSTCLEISITAKFFPQRGEARLLTR
jgi:hypothetical protein